MHRASARSAHSRRDRLRLTNRGRVFVILGVALAVAGLTLGYGDITRVGVFLIALPLLAWVIAASHPTRLQLTRKITPTQLNPDDTAVVRTVFRNTAGRSTRLGTAQDRVDPGFGDRPRYTLTSIPTRGSATVEYQLRSHVRGRHVLGPVIITHPDPFGMCTSLTVLPAHDEIVVLPKTFALPQRRLPFASGGSNTGGDAIALRGEQDVSIRAYVEGDELRRIHWPATAHRGELMVRHEDQPEHRRALLWFDARSSAHHDAGRHSSFEWTISAVASIALLLEDLQYQLQGLGEHRAVQGRTPAALTADEMLRDLALATRCTDAEHADLVSVATHAFARGSVLIALVTDRPDPGLKGLLATGGAGRTSLAIVVDTEAYRTDSAEHGAGAQQVAATLRAAGWRAAIAGPGTGIPAAWHLLMSTAATGAGR